jgi:uncharacterized protein (DUF362 family)
MRELFQSWKLDARNARTSFWNPLGDVIPAGSSVVLKPNWVSHCNRSGHGLDCLVTHASVIEAVVKYVMLTNPRRILIGDAPLQGCDFESLKRLCGVDEMAQRLRRHGVEVQIADFRRTVLTVSSRDEEARGIDSYVLFDLGQNSLLEFLAADSDRFRVTMYNPDEMFRTHARGKHQYLIAREVLDADVLINLPKLKTHKKAGVTGALKNMAGINGHKEYLPHHRKGGASDGGDCYEGSFWLKRRAEDLLDFANRRQPGRVQSLLAESASALARHAAANGGNADLEGSWHGNNTVWRTCLDLQRIAHYGRWDGSLAGQRQRRIITITDAIVAGEGEGPLANTPAPSGFLTAAVNTAAADWVHARLMGFDPVCIPLIRESFGEFAWPVAGFDPSTIRVRCGGSELAVDEVFPWDGHVFLPPRGWQGHCELERPSDTSRSKQTVVA